MLKDVSQAKDTDLKDNTATQKFKSLKNL